MRWLARNSQGNTVVEAKNWLWAIAQAQHALGLPTSAYESMFAVRREDGGLNVRLSIPETIQLFPLRADTDEAAALAATPADHSWLDLSGTPSEVTAILGARIGTLTIQTDRKKAAELALDIVDALIGAESMSILEHKKDGMHFVAARGPHADGLGQYVLDNGRGIAGYVFETGHGVLFNDITQSTTHLHAIDDATGYRPSAILAVPIGDEAGYHGVIELLNSGVDFQHWQIGVLRAVGAALSHAWRDAP